jgi:hypothetical protein
VIHQFMFAGHKPGLSAHIVAHDAMSAVDLAEAHFVYRSVAPQPIGSPIKGKRNMRLSCQR